MDAQQLARAVKNQQVKFLQRVRSINKQKYFASELFLALKEFHFLFIELEIIRLKFFFSIGISFEEKNLLRELDLQLLRAQYRH